MINPSFGVPLHDALGQVHRPFEGTPRIVSLVPSLTELVCDLGLAGRLAGRSGFCIHPRALVKSIPKVGGTKDVDLDKVRALAPTHLIVNVDENRREQVEELARFVPHVIVTHPRRPEDNPELFRLLGGIFGAQARAGELSARFWEAYDAVREAARDFPREHVLYLIWRKPWMTVAPGTYISAMLKAVNWYTVPAKSAARYPVVDFKAFGSGFTTYRHTQRILLASEPFPFREKHLAEVGALPEFRGLPAQLIDGEMVSWYGSRAIAGLRYLLEQRTACV